MESLLKSFEEYPTIWILLSAGVGGVIGACIKFLFDHILAARVSGRREVRKIVTRYSNPILRAAESLERRINNFILTYDKKWFNNDDYYRLSTLYIFAQFLGWSRILEREVVFLDFGNLRSSREFNIRFNTVFKSFTGFDYFRDIPDTVAVDSSTVPRLVLTAIGDLMIEAHGDTHGSSSGVIQFTTFVTRYEKVDEFKRWLKYLEDFLSNLKPSTEDLRWDRLIVIGANLRVLVRFLDPKGTRTRPRPICNLERMLNGCVRERLLQEIKMSDYSRILGDVDSYSHLDNTEPGTEKEI